MRTVVFQHASFEGIGSIHGWLHRHYAAVTTARLFAGDKPPQTTAGVDLVIAMGGPMSVNDERELPWLVGEKRFIREAIENGVAVVGICLGAQLIASAMGARVYRNADKEIGYVQPESEILTSDAELFTSGHRLMDRILDYIALGISDTSPTSTSDLDGTSKARRRNPV